MHFKACCYSLKADSLVKVTNQRSVSVVPASFPPLPRKRTLHLFLPFTPRWPWVHLAHTPEASDVLPTM